MGTSAKHLNQNDGGQNDQSRNDPADIARVAKERLGFDELRPGQSEAVQAILDGHDTLVVQPTGSGKSAIYQIAGLLIEGATVIVSPLIALQKDQVDSIRDQNSAAAAAVNSAQKASHIRENVQRLEEGELEYIFLSPEQLAKPSTIETLQRSNVSLFVVDEAHCVSQWGHDFRPDYLRLGAAIEALGHPRVLALTATASPRVREEIAERLGLREPKIFVQGFDRPNIYLRVDKFETETEKRDALIHRVRWADKPGIIYVATRRAAREVMQALEEEGVDSLYYHGGLGRKERDEAHEWFMSGARGVMVATNAFGMGVDKPDVRFVYHYDPPDSPDSYYQEIGRAGRDGERADAILFFRQEDIGSQSFHATEGKPDPELLEQFATRLAAIQGPPDYESMSAELGIAPRKLSIALQHLEDTGVAEIRASGEVHIAEDADLSAAAQQAAEEQEGRSGSRRARLERMREYGDTTKCRREMLLRYLGDDYNGPCNFCDNCDATQDRVPIDPSAGTRREIV